ncbi:YSIRK-type signal peptide-containing protein [Gemella sp.]
MSSKNKYSARKITAVFTSLLMGVTASSYGTIFAQETNSKSTVEMKNDIQGRHIKNPVIEDSNTQKSGKSNNFNEVSLETDGGSTETSRESEGDKLEVDDIFEEIVKEKIDWNLVDGKAFVDNLLSKVDVDDKRQEIKKLWLAKINELLKIHINNENLLHIKNILLEGISEDDKKDGESSNNKAVKSEEKDTAREESPDNKKADKEDQEKDKKETPEEKVSEDKKESKDNKAVESENKDTAREESSGNKKDNKEDQEKDKKETPDGKVLDGESTVENTNKISNDKKIYNNSKENLVNRERVKNQELSASLSGRAVTVSFDKNKIDADDVFVGAINDENLNKEIIRKLGNEYKIIEVFEIHFKKDGEKLDSKEERTVKVSVVKNDNAELEVYHISDNNVLEKVKSKYSDGSLQFKIDHFSKFTILERIRVGVKDLESRVQIVDLTKDEYSVENKELFKNPIGNNSNNGEKSANGERKNGDLPNTGLESSKTLWWSLIILGITITLIRRRKQ